MEVLLLVVVTVLGVASLLLGIQLIRLRRRIARGERDRTQLLADVQARERASAELYDVKDRELAESARALRAKAEEAQQRAEQLMTSASDRAAEIIDAAQARAREIAGSALDALNNAEQNRRIAQAMKNIIEGYGDQYLVPPESLLDELAESFSHKDAGQRLKQARAHTLLLAKNGRAAQCEYVESSRRERAERFVLDAFNGKVDSILSRVKEDNSGKLAQEIHDAFALVNYNGEAFRDARITSEYLDARLEELRWGAAAQQLRREELDEQRRIREQMREEAKAQREIERALKDAAKEEDTLRKAMAKAAAQIEQASAEQRTRYEAQLAELTAKLAQAEEKGKRALSMAQQTKRGHVYIISNPGSFGEDVFKIGMTRRLDPLDRIWELGDSSVPFPFDVHAMILCEDAPALECQLHKHFVLSQINKVNHRKEFFRTSTTALRSEIEGLGIQAHWTMVADAREYRESLAIDRVISEDPRARDQWIRRQLTLDPLDVSLDDSDEETSEEAMARASSR